MHEMITIKKQGPGIVHLLISGVLAGLSFFADQAALNHYLKERHYERLSGGEKVFWFSLCFLLTLLFLETLTYFAGALVLVLLDREQYVAVRKSSMANEKAKEIVRNYRKRIFLIQEINNLVMYLILSVILMLYLVKGGVEKSTLYLAIIILVLVMTVNPVTAKLLKKEKMKVDALFLTQCDAQLSYDIHEQLRQVKRAPNKKYYGLLQQAEFSYFLGDYPEMASKLNACKDHLNFLMKPMHIYYRGLYALDIGDRDAFNHCVREMDEFVLSKKTLPPHIKYIVDLTRREWKVRVDLIDGDPAMLIPVLIQMIPQEKSRPDWMNRTFQLAWLQLKVGDKAEARQNLTLVAEGAGTMIIRKRAIEFLQDLDKAK